MNPFIESFSYVLVPHLDLKTILSLPSMDAAFAHNGAIYGMKA